MLYFIWTFVELYNGNCYLDVDAFKSMALLGGGGNSCINRGPEFSNSIVDILTKYEYVYYKTHV